MKIYRKIFLIVVVAFLISNKSYAQDIYRTQDGDMLITAVSADTILKVTTKKLLVLLNYENAKFTIKMDKSTFYTGNDSLDRQLKLLKYEIIEFEGKLDLEHIDINSDPLLDFGVEGVISTNNHIIKGVGHIEHISNRGAFSCLLTLRFNIKKDDLGLNLDNLNLKDDIQIEIVQVMLNKSDNQ